MIQALFFLSVLPLAAGLSFFRPVVRLQSSKSCCQWVTDARALSRPTRHTDAPWCMATGAGQQKPRIVVAGAPASGKGTQCELLRQRYGSVHLSTGDMLREAVAQGTAIGLQAQDYISNGRLVPDELFVDMLTERLQGDECRRRGWLLDGFPLTLTQAQELTDAGAQPDVFLLLDVPNDVLRERLEGRRVDPVTGKTYHLRHFPPTDPQVAARLVALPDDASDKAALRIAAFRRQCDAVAAYYSPLLARVDANQDAESIFAAASQAIDASLSGRARCARARAASAGSSAAAVMAAAARASGAAVGATAVAAPPAELGLRLGSSAVGKTKLGPAGVKRGAAVAAVAGDAVRTVASLSLLVGADVALAAAFKAAALAFPSSLAGMVALFAGLLVLDGVKPAAAAAVVAALAPGGALLSRWMPVFFVPSLVALPLAPPMATADAARLAVLVVGGYVASLLSTAAMAAPLRSSKSPKSNNKSSGSSGSSGSSSTQASDSESAAAAVKPRPAPRAFPKRLARSLALLAAGVGGLSMTVLRNASAWASNSQQLYLLLATLHGYVLGTRLPAAFTRVVHPVVTCALLSSGAAALLSAALHVPLARVLAAYMARPGAAAAAAAGGAGGLLLRMLGPSILSFALQMFERRRLMWRNLAAVALVPTAAGAAGLFGTAAAARALSLTPGLRLATVSRCITSPLAIAITGMLGGDASVAVALVVVSGVLGANVGARLLDLGGVRDPVARGLAQGASSHGLGTAAMANEPEAFAFSAVSMALTATASTVLVSLPPVRDLLLRVALGAAAL